MNHRRRTVLPCPDCCAPRQSLDRKSTRNSHTLLRAGNEVLWERQRQRVEVYFCTVTTTLHVEYFRDLYKTEYDWGDLDCLRENRPYPPGTWQDSWALYHSKNSHLQTYIHQAMAPCTVSYCICQVDTCSQGRPKRFDWEAWRGFGLTFQPFGVVFDRPQGRSITHTAIDDRIAGLEVSDSGRIQFPLWKEDKQEVTKNNWLHCYSMFCCFAS